MTDPYTGAPSQPPRAKHIGAYVTDWLAVTFLSSIVMFGKHLAPETQMAAILMIGGIAGVASWMRGKGLGGSAVILIASWPIAKLLGALGATYRL